MFVKRLIHQFIRLFIEFAADVVPGNFFESQTAGRGRHLLPDTRGSTV
jgi:hypothetical protein